MPDQAKRIAELEERCSALVQALNGVSEFYLASILKLDGERRLLAERLAGVDADALTGTGDDQIPREIVEALRDPAFTERFNALTGEEALALARKAHKK